MHVRGLFSPARGSSARGSSARCSSAQRCSLRHLCFTPLPMEEMDEEQKFLSSANTSMSSISDSSTSSASTPPAAPLNPTVLRMPSLNLRAGLVRNMSGDVCQWNPSRRSLSVPLDSFMGRQSGSFSDSGEYPQKSANVTAQPLSGEEVAVAMAAYERYMEHIQEAGCLITLLKDLDASDDGIHCELWLGRLENFLGVSREQLMGASFGGEENGESVDINGRRVLTNEELLCFVTWLKSSCGELIRSRPPQMIFAYEAAVAAEGGESTKTEPHVREKGRGGYFSAGRSNNTEHTKNGDAVASPSLSHVKKKKVPLSGRSRCSGRSPSPPGNVLHERIFGHLGGRSDGGGTIRLARLQRFLRKFHMNVDFGTLVGSVIDVNCTGRITFSEFLWVLEFGVQGGLPAVAMRQHLLKGESFGSRPTKGSALRLSGSCSPGRRSPRTPQQGGGCVSRWCRWSTKISREDGRPPLLHATEWRENLPRVRTATRGGVKNKRTRAFEEVRRGYLDRIESMSPYMRNTEWKRLSTRVAGRERCHSKECKVRSAKHVGKFRMSTFDSKNSTIHTSHRSGTARRRSVSPAGTAKKSLHNLRQKQMKLVKRLEALTIHPLDAHDACWQQKQLECVQKELGTVLGQIGAAFRQMAIDSQTN